MGILVDLIIYVGNDVRNQFSVEVHHAGFFCGIGTNRCYVDGKIDWFDYVDEDVWSTFWIDEFIMLLGYGMSPGNLKVYWLLAGKELIDGLRIVESDDDTIMMASVVDRVKNLVLYFDHDDHVGRLSHEDIVINPVADLPKVFSLTKVGESG